MAFIRFELFIVVILFAGYVLGSAIEQDKNEVSLAEEAAMEKVRLACEKEANEQSCLRRLDLNHDACFRANFRPAQYGKYHQSAAHLRINEYVPCVASGEAQWRKSKRRRSEELAQYTR